jgi:hypothetical protein
MWKLLQEPLNDEEFICINATGYPNEFLFKLGFIDVGFILTDKDNIDINVRDYLLKNLIDCRRVCIVLPHYRPCLPYFVPAIEMLVGQPPLIVYLRKGSDSKYRPYFIDVKDFKLRCKEAKHILNKKMIDKFN